MTAEPIERTPRNLSALLSELIESSETQGERTSLAFIIEAFHERGFGVLLFFLALPAALPVPALGINVIIALPILLLTIQQAMGRHKVWLPESVMRRSFKTSHLQGFLKKSIPFVLKIEEITRARFAFLTRGLFSKLIGVFGIIFAISVTIPVPLTNTVPSMAICFMSIGVIMRDGLFVIGGMVLGTAWITMLIVLTLLFGAAATGILHDQIHMIKDFVFSLF
ncbi:MAG: exopolysaccharide biosynthesis protein [Pseudobdellovibrionaceae bacterium]